MPENLDLCNIGYEELLVRRSVSKSSTGEAPAFQKLSFSGWIENLKNFSTSNGVEKFLIVFLIGQFLLP